MTTKAGADRQAALPPDPIRGRDTPANALPILSGRRYRPDCRNQPHPPCPHAAHGRHAETGMSPDMTLHDKTALITGSARGIGLA